MADEIVRKIDYDFEQFKVNKNFVLNVALRAKKLDEVASGFIRHHPDAVGLDLGGRVGHPGVPYCGAGSRSIIW